MKKIIFFPLLSIVFACFLLCTTVFSTLNVNYASAETRSITVINCDDYIDDELLTEFTEQTGIEVNYITMATPEEMYNEIIKDINACNLLCPSEYMIMKMMGEGLIKPYSVPENFTDFGSDYIKDTFKKLGAKNVDGEFVPIMSEDETTSYAVGYMWGTMGFLYNQDNGTTADDLKNWKSINGEKFNKRVTIKDSIRDTYIMAVGAVYQEELMALDKNDPDYNKKLTEIFNRADEETLQRVEIYLQELRQHLYGFEVDSGKNDIVTGKIDVNFAWSGDAVAAMYEGDEIGVSLGYAVPEEGTNVWFDGFVMTRNTNGQKEADCIEFLNFLCDPENVVRNMDYIGYTSCIGGDVVWDYVLDCYNTFESTVLTESEYNELSDEEKESYKLYDGNYYEIITVDDKECFGEYKTDDQGNIYLQTFDIDDSGNKTLLEDIELYSVDLKYFFDPSCEDDSYTVYSIETGRLLYAAYADEETIMRAAIMDNFDQDTLAGISAMWNRVKLVTLPTYAIILICVGIVLVIAAVLLIRYKDKIFKTKIPDKKKQSGKNGLVEVKREDLI